MSATPPAGSPPRRLALLSVHDKTGLVPFAQALVERGFALLSTGGTARALREAGLAVTDVAEHTGAPEMLEGRVKSLHPRVHAGLLARRDHEDDLAELARHGIPLIDLVCVNLYPFEQAVEGGERDPGALRELVDVGGPTLLRAAAKGWPWVTVVPSPDAYAEVEGAMDAGGGVPEALRRSLAARAFARVSAYDAAIASALASEVAEAESGDAADAYDEGLPALLPIALGRVGALRYGENPHQRGALYRPLGRPASDLGALAVEGGKALSYNNLLDLDAALQLARELLPLEPGGAAAAVVKHASPCGAAIAAEPAAAFRAAHACDPLSAFGGVVALLPRVTREAALAMTEPDLFIECVVSGGFDPEALEVLTSRPRWGASVRLVTCAAGRRTGDELLLRSIAGGVLVQVPDLLGPLEQVLAARTTRRPSAAEDRDLRAAIACAKHARSNAIAVVHGGRLLGLGGGQPSRVGAVELALDHAGESAKGAVLASDGFFPFPDSIERAAAAGIAAIAAPSGSKRDDEVVAAAERLGLALVFTRARHFRH